MLLYLIPSTYRLSILTAVFVFQILFLCNYLWRSDTRRPSPEHHLSCIDVETPSFHSFSFSVQTFLTHFPVSAELIWARLCPTQTPRRWSRSTPRCDRAWGGLWWWPAGCWERTLPACCDSSGCCQTGCSTPAPSMPKEMRRSTPSAAWIETAGGSTPAMSSTKPEQGNALSTLQVKKACYFKIFSCCCSVWKWLFAAAWSCPAHKGSCQ